MPDLTFGSVVIYVDSDVRKVLDFYQAAFDLPIRYYDDTLRFGELETGGPPIMIASYAAGELMIGGRFRKSPSGRPEDVEIAFITDDVQSAFSKAVAAGASVIREPRTMPWGQTVAYVASIEGTIVGLLTPPPPLPAEK